MQSRPPSSLSRSLAARGAPAPLLGERVEFGNPWLDVLALPVSVLGALALSSTQFGRLLAVPLQIQFHELGHALVAWLSSRAALPLPFGFTFWREERSTFTGLCVAFLLGLLFVQADRERKPFGVLLSALAIVAWVMLTFVASNEHCTIWIIAGGVAGEFALTALAMIAFSFPLPDRLRWDFFRLLVLPLATFAWVSSARLWIGVARGTEPLPLGSILGSPGDLSGDLDRLIHLYGWSATQITRGYVWLCALSGSLVLGSHAFFALRALRKKSQSTTP
jgi:hypothetical protein